MHLFIAIISFMVQFKPRRQSSISILSNRICPKHTYLLLNPWKVYDSRWVKEINRENYFVFSLFWQGKRKKQSALKGNTQVSALTSSMTMRDAYISLDLPLRRKTIRLHSYILKKTVIKQNASQDFGPLSAHARSTCSMARLLYSVWIKTLAAFNNT